MKSSFVLPGKKLTTFENFGVPINRLSKSKIAHMAILAFILISATFSVKLALGISIAWIIFSIYKYVILPIAKIDVDFRIKDDMVRGVEKELWP